MVSTVYYAPFLLIEMSNSTRPVAVTRYESFSSISSMCTAWLKVTITSAIDRAFVSFDACII